MSTLTKAAGFDDIDLATRLDGVAQNRSKVNHCYIHFRELSTEVLRHVRDDRIVAIIETSRGGNKSGKHAFRKFLDKAVGSLYREIHLLIVDLQPPTPRDPDGIHAAIWSEIEPDDESPPPKKPLTLVSYLANQAITAYVEPISVNDTLPDMPLFLEPERYVNLPLEVTYGATWKIMPPHVKKLVES